MPWFGEGELEEDRGRSQSPVGPDAGFFGRTSFLIADQSDGGGVKLDVTAAQRLVFQILVKGLELLTGLPDQGDHGIGGQINPQTGQLALLAVVGLMIGEAPGDQSGHHGGVDAAFAHHLPRPGGVDGRLARGADENVTADQSNKEASRLPGEHFEAFDEADFHQLAGDRADQLVQLGIGDLLPDPGQIRAQGLGALLAARAFGSPGPFERLGLLLPEFFLEALKGALSRIVLRSAPVTAATKQPPLQFLDLQAQDLDLRAQSAVLHAEVFNLFEQFGVEGFSHLPCKYPYIGYLQGIFSLFLLFFFFIRFEGTAERAFASNPAPPRAG